jgi:hypothetical protein
MTFASQHLLIIGLVCWTSVACAPSRKIDNTRNYDAAFVCDGTKVVKISFTPFAATLASDGVSADLTQQPADGLLYTGGGQRLQAHGNEATWTDNKGVSHRCREHAGETNSNMPSR